ncbi:hypothetical protein MRX96_044147 [Rhipicephalus microplus]
MAASVAPLETAPYDCSGADDNVARPRTLRTVSGYAIYPIAHHEDCPYSHLPVTCGSSDAMSASSGNPDVKLLIGQKHHKPAFDFISNALKYDRENDNLKELAIDLFREGIEELQKSVPMDFSQEKGPTCE